MRRYLFYFSYARGNSSPYLKKFSDDLSQAVREKAGLALNEAAGFIEPEYTEWGDDWPRATADALQNSQTMVCLLSPAYFNSEFCGKEWQIFRMRQRLYVERELTLRKMRVLLPPVIKPVLWIPPRGEMPKVVADTQHVFGDLAAPPNKDGLSFLLKRINEYRSSYEDFLDGLATDVLNTAYAFKLPSLDHVPPLKEVPNVFVEPNNMELDEQPSPSLKKSPAFDSLWKRISGEGRIDIKKLMMSEPDATSAAELKKDEPKKAESFSGVFISYRRGEAAAYAGRLYDRLAAHFGKEKVFFDRANVGLGEDFVDIIKSAAGSCAVLIALISPLWLRGRGGQEELDDFVRLEVATALGRKIRVIPVVIPGATMPTRKDLPEDLAPLAHRSPLEISDARWERDVEDLMKTLEGLLNG